MSDYRTQIQTMSQAGDSHAEILLSFHPTERVEARGVMRSFCEEEKGAITAATSLETLKTALESYGTHLRATYAQGSMPVYPGDVTTPDPLPANYVSWDATRALVLNGGVLSVENQ